MVFDVMVYLDKKFITGVSEREEMWLNIEFYIITLIYFGNKA